MEEYIRFPAATTPEIWDFVKELREFRDAETEAFLARMNQNCCNCNRKIFKDKSPLDSLQIEIKDD